MMTSSAGAGERDALLTAIRWPLIAVAACLPLLLLAFALDTGGERSRDAALLIGVATLYVLLPLALLWLLVAVLRHLTRRRRG